MPDVRHALESALTRAWMRRGLVARILWPLSQLFRTVVTFRRGLYAVGLLGSPRLPVPVVVVGNIFVGGTGKTPLVIWLAQMLRNAGFTPGIISRGYGAKNALPMTVTIASPPQQVGDEPLLMAQRTACPIMIGRDRVAAGKALLATHPDVNIIISDDGLQHYALERDVEIVLFDDRGIGNGWMLPAGPLREPATRWRDITVVNGSRTPEGFDDVAFMQLVGDSAEKLADRSQRVALSDLLGIMKNTTGRTPKLLAAAGIGNPGRFFDLLRQAGLSFEELPLPDHFDYKTSPFINKDADIILITEKDAVKCALFGSSEIVERLWVVPVTAQLDAELAERIVERCRGSRIA
jgi:tetraacyldisaccharide 4'-kinase